MESICNKWLHVCQMSCMQTIDERWYIATESQKGFRVCSVKNSGFYKFPNSFNQVQVWWIGWQEAKIDSKLSSFACDSIATLVSGIIKDYVDYSSNVNYSKLLKHRDDLCWGDICIILSSRANLGLHYLSSIQQVVNSVKTKNMPTFRDSVEVIYIDSTFLRWMHRHVNIQNCRRY